MHPVFHAVGQGDAHDLFQKAPVPGENISGPVSDRAVLPEAIGRHQRGEKDPGKQGGPCHAGCPHAQEEHARTVADHIDAVGGDGDLHGHIGPADAAAQGRAAGGKGRKQEDEDGVEGSHQRYAGNIRFAGKADHEGVGNADEHQEKLLHKQGQDQVPQVSVRKYRHTSYCCVKACLQPSSIRSTFAMSQSQKSVAIMAAMPWACIQSWSCRRSASSWPIR